MEKKVWSEMTNVKRGLWIKFLMKRKRIEREYHETLYKRIESLRKKNIFFTDFVNFYSFVLMIFNDFS